MYIETAPLIYYIEKHPTYIAKMDAIIEVVENSGLKTVIHTNCDALLTNDIGIKRVTELSILILDELEP